MRILLIEDEESIANFVRNGLAQDAYEVDWAANGSNGLHLARAVEYDAVILDMMLPDTDGLQVVRELRSNGLHLPVLALTARDSLEHRVEGLDAGCDDYLTKPFAFEELLARLRALLRRPRKGRLSKIEYRSLELDPATRTVKRDNAPIELSNREYALLEMFMRHPGEVLTRGSLMEAVWGFDQDPESNVLDVYIHGLRKKLHSPHTKSLLHTLRGVGFVLR
jgi:DNA-binding response OmpR family regulator